MKLLSRILASTMIVVLVVTSSMLTSTAVVTSSDELVYYYVYDGQYRKIGDIRVEDDEIGTKEEEASGIIVNANVPYGASINSAKLKLFIYKSDRDGRTEVEDSAFIVYENDAWDDYRYKPDTGDNIATLNYRSMHREWLEVDITKYVKDWVELKSSNCGFFLAPVEVSTGEQVKAYFGTPSRGNPPCIEVDYTPDPNVFPNMETFYSWGIGYNDDNAEQVIIQNIEGDSAAQYHAGVKFNVESINGAVIHDAKMVLNPDMVSINPITVEFGEADSDWTTSLIKPNASMTSSFTLNDADTRTQKYIDITSMCQSWVDDPSNNNGLIFAPQATGADCEVVLHINTNDLYLEPFMNIDYSYKPEVVSTNIDDSTIINSDFVPSINVIDKDGQELICEMYLGDSITPYSVVNCIETTVAKEVVFDSINISEMENGSHTIKFRIKDTRDLIEEVTYTFHVDTEPPLSEVVQSSITTNNVVLDMNATDSIAGLDILPYKYSFNSEITEWTDNSQYLKENLAPNTSYPFKVETKDSIGNISEINMDVVTLSEVPELGMVNAGRSTITLSINDNNPISTEYLIMCDDKYVDESGRLIDEEVWVPKAYSGKVVSGLSSLTEYSFVAKSRNSLGVITDASTILTCTTTAMSENQLDYIAAKRSSDVIELSWSDVNGASSYQLSINGTAYTSSENSFSIHSPEITSIMVKAVDEMNSDITEWSEVIVVGTENSTIVLRQFMATDERIDLYIHGTDLYDGQNLRYAISYNPSTLILEDASLLTADKETGPEDSNDYIDITKHLDGELVISSKITLNETGPYSGVANVVRFATLSNEMTSIIIRIEE